MVHTVDWPAAIQPLIKKYKGNKFPLNYGNLYQLVVMVLLAAQDSDKHINEVSEELFKHFPDMTALSKVEAEDLHPFLKSVRNFANKSKWLTTMAKTVKADKHIPQAMEALVALPGIGRKSANVILRESKKPAQGVIVDLHVMRVAPRLGIATGKTPDKVEKELMQQLPQEQWDAGMCMSFLGREICRPTNPKCEICIMNKVCAYYLNLKKVS
ncbi:endonuclease III domain-containing protein [Haoranjiania flava]|uniref:Endonuclease III n=1 Tax=Haoranjiania flava TaxID=1856322 RepID=A0AAE3IK06_9BACT|nr:endonuclease III [Haoranjiania flava]MCU7693475.1 endonuclease III [Haoranjiania flava]